MVLLLGRVLAARRVLATPPCHTRLASARLFCRLPFSSSTSWFSKDAAGAALSGSALLRRSLGGSFTRRCTRAFSQYPTQAPVSAPAAMLTAGGLMVGSYLLLNSLLNNASSDIAVRFGSTLPRNAREYLHGTYQYVFSGICITAASATMAYRSGLVTRMMANPIMFMGLSLVGTMGTMFSTMAINHHESPVLKHVLWASSMGAIGALSLSPMCILPPALLGRAAVYTAGIIGSLSVVAMNAEEGAFLWLGAPLMAGLTVVALSSLATVFAPVGGTVFRATHSISLYGGLAVFGGLMLYDTQQVLMRGAANLHPNPDYINESYSIYLNTINIFVRMVQILAMQQSSSRRR